MNESIAALILGAISSIAAAIFWGKKKYKKGYARGRVDQVEEIRKEISGQKKLIEKVEEKSEEIAKMEKEDNAKEAEELKSAIPSRDFIEEMIEDSKE